MFFSYPVSQSIQEWILENFIWAHDKGLLSRDTPLVLPDKTFFKAPSGKGPETATALVRDFQVLMGITNVPITVEPIGQLPPEYRHSYGQIASIAGTFHNDGKGGYIRYDPNLFSQPMALLSTLAHEVMHQRLQLIAEYPPGGPETEELATDLHVITMGMGILQMTGAEASGWQGYLSQPSRAHALAVFLLARGMPIEAAIAALPPRSAKLVTKSVRQIGRNASQLAEVRALLN